MENEREWESLAKAMGAALAIKTNKKKYAYFAALESEFGPFPEDIDGFARSWLRLQGHDLDYLQREAEVLIEIDPLSGGDRVLLVLLAWD